MLRTTNETSNFLHVSISFQGWSGRSFAVTSNNPSFFVRVPPSRVQNPRCDFPQVTTIFLSHGWNSAAITGSVELWGKDTRFWFRTSLNSNVKDDIYLHAFQPEHQLRQQSLLKDQQQTRLFPGKKAMPELVRWQKHQQTGRAAMLKREEGASRTMETAWQLSKDKTVALPWFLLFCALSLLCPTPTQRWCVHWPRPQLPTSFHHPARDKRRETVVTSVAKLLMNPNALQTNALCIHCNVLRKNTFFLYNSR